MTLTGVIIFIIATVIVFTAQTSPIMLFITLLMIAGGTSILITELSNWAALILLLIYVGGLLVIFSYFIALAPNNNLSPIAIIYILIITVCLLNNQPNIVNSIIGESTIESSRLQVIMEPNLLVFLGVVLLIILIVVAKIAARYSGALRPHA